MAVSIFWCATVGLIICALGCIIPPLWAGESKHIFHNSTRIKYSFLALMLLSGLSYTLYWKFGAAPQLSSYYNKGNMQQRKDFKKIRPLYWRLQRELLKSKLDLELDLNNIELILHFAQAHSQSQHGILDNTVKNLLQAVLKAMPQQVTALNLLAIDAYKTENYAQAIVNWQLILQQFTGEMRGGKLEAVLLDKIVNTQARLKEFESRRTK